MYYSNISFHVISRYVHKKYIYALNMRKALCADNVCEKEQAVVSQILHPFKHIILNVPLKMINVHSYDDKWHH